MNHYSRLAVTCAIALSIVGCTTPQNATPVARAGELTVSTNFTDEGVKLTYSALGNLKSVEIYGQAEVWRSNFEAIAEADAFAKLTKFTYGSKIQTQRRVNIIGRSISNAREIAGAKKNTTITQFSDTELESADPKSSNGLSSETLRDANAVNEATVSTLTTIVAQGRLLGVRKIRDLRQDDGKIYVAVYQWSAEDVAAADLIRNRMQQQK